MRTPSPAHASTLATIAVIAGLAAPACGKSLPALFTGDDGTPSSLNEGGSDAAVPILRVGCVGYECSVAPCVDGGATTISGAVYDPAGNSPLANVVVYVPGSPPGPLTTGASCDSCRSLYSGGAIAATVTDATGKFSLPNVPVGNSIPLVVQIGKWRKQTSVDTVTACADNPLPALRLPASQAEGDLPSIAISTGGADSLECLLLRIGVAPSEYSAGASGSGRIHIFQGSSAPAANGAAPTTAPPAPRSSDALWSSVANLLPYDITILSCEGGETVDVADGGPLTESDQQNLLAYTSAGDALFASHFHYAWFTSGPFDAENVATWTRGANPITDSSNNPVPITSPDFINANILTVFADGGPFPKGQLLDRWLGAVGALNTGTQPAPGELRIYGAKHNADLAALGDTPSQGWIAADKNAQAAIYSGQATDGGPPASAAGATEYLSFNTPVDAGLDDSGEPAYCGRVVYSDLHVGAASGDYGGSAAPIVPAGCARGPLTAQEKVLEFMLFDLSSCVTPDTGTGTQPVPGPIK